MSNENAPKVSLLPRADDGFEGVEIGAAGESGVDLEVDSRSVPATGDAVGGGETVDEVVDVVVEELVTGCDLLGGGEDLVGTLGAEEEGPSC
mmetsp:Transcript_27365/g.39196  ORF Transcript_27365/g.39196 Transcript_27365/m.39196 type:complete len:92 (+) Transcript_27365:53-328(+)